VEGVAVRALLDAGALAGLILGAALGARHRAGGVLFIALCLGSASGYRVIGAAFRRGRRRQGRDPEPSRGAARILGGFIGFWIKLILGFACWALLLQFFQRVY
jgi:hypothetical protein